jgi:hypothetical protein
MINHALLFLALPAALMAQNAPAFSNVAADSVGNLYMQSSLSLRTARPATAGNIFHYTKQSGWTWFTPDWAPAYGIVDVSSAGDVMAVTDSKTFFECFGSTNHCDYVTTATARIVAPGYHLDSFTGSIRISRNGRYAVLTGPSSQTLLDLTTGLSRPLLLRTQTAPKQTITDTGCVLLHGSNAQDLLLTRLAGDAHFSTAQQFDVAKIDGGEPASSTLLSHHRRRTRSSCARSTSLRDRTVY